MLCQNCKKEIAVVYVEQIINNNKVEINLCENCAKNIGVMNFDMPVGINEFFSNFMTSSTGQREKICERCNTTYSDFKNTGKIGCSDCYDTFDDALEPLLKRIHGSNVHSGKIPEYENEKLKEPSIEFVTKTQLRKQLDEAISDERYEDAARIRDKLKEMKG